MVDEPTDGLGNRPVASKPVQSLSTEKQLAKKRLLRFVKGACNEGFWNMFSAADTVGPGTAIGEASVATVDTSLE